MEDTLDVTSGLVVDVGCSGDMASVATDALEIVAEGVAEEDIMPVEVVGDG